MSLAENYEPEIAVTPVRYDDELPIASLTPSPTNPRKTFNEAKLKELAESIQRHGVIEPILVRPHKTNNGMYEIVVGERRWRASKIAGCSTIPAKIKDLSDVIVLEIQIIENCQREGVHPIEEAEGFAKLIEANQQLYTPEVIGQKIGKSTRYVIQRLALNNLTDQLKQIFLANEIGIGHAFLLCRLQESDQQRAAKEALFEEDFEVDGGKRVSKGKRLMPIAELKHWIESRIMLVLDKAPWDRTDKSLPGGACTACVKRTGHNIALFDDLGKEDKCMDVSCYQKKQETFLAREITQAKRRGESLVPVVRGGSKEAPKKAVLGHEYHIAATSCRKHEPALIVAGDDVGKRITICRDAKCLSRATPAANKLTPEQEQKRREAQLVADIRKAQRLATIQCVMAKVTKLGKLELSLFAQEWIDLDYLSAFCEILGIDSDASVSQVNDALRKASEEKLAKVLVGSLIACNFDSAGTSAITEAYKIDRNAIDQEIETKMKLEFKRGKA